MNARISSILISMILVSSLVVSSCSISISIDATAAPAPTIPPTAVDVAPTPVANPTVTEEIPTEVVPTQTEEPHELYAGLTGDNDIPFLILHESGERIGVVSDGNSSTITKVIWSAKSGESIIFYTDSDRRPINAVVGEDIIHYSNYTNDTVDLQIIHPDGTQEVLRTKLSTRLTDRLMASSESPYNFASYLVTNRLRQQQQYTWQLIDDGLFAFEIGACVLAGGAFSTNILALVALATACHSPILELKIREGKAENIDVGNLESAQEYLELFGCSMGNVVDCINRFVGDMADAEAEANQRVANIPPILAPTKCVGKYKDNCK